MRKQSNKMVALLAAVALAVTMVPEVSASALSLDISESDESALDSGIINTGALVGLTEEGVEETTEMTEVVLEDETEIALGEKELVVEEEETTEAEATELLLEESTEKSQEESTEATGLIEEESTELVLEEVTEENTERPVKIESEELNPIVKLEEEAKPEGVNILSIGMQITFSGSTQYDFIRISGRSNVNRIGGSCVVQDMNTMEFVSVWTVSSNKCEYVISKPLKAKKGHTYCFSYTGYMTNNKGLKENYSCKVTRKY